MIGSLRSSSLTRTLRGRRRPYRPPGTRAAPDLVRLDPLPGHAPSAAPPVRIFVGTEHGQYRSERVFVWSVARHRDPQRAYEIYLMRDLVGYDRRRWLTGFTNYRFAVPSLAGASGRAIYNDVDQIYLADPAGLFDLDLGGHGFLALSSHETSVMLIDCARMAAVWTPADAQRARRKAIEAKARQVPDVCGPLPPEWHARDAEYTAGTSKLVHFTTIHTQPWQPFPEIFVYQPNPVAEVWLALEREAIAAGFHVFTAAQPSPRFAALQARAADERPAPSAVDDGPMRAALRQADVRTLLVCSAAATPDSSTAAPAVTRADLYRLDTLRPSAWDAVVCRDGLEQLPLEDVPWVVDTLFARASRVVWLEIDPVPSRTRRADDREALDERWWLNVLEEAGRRFPGVGWQLVMRRGRGTAARVHQGGRRPDGCPPQVWVLADEKLGHTTQSVGVARALGWPYEVKQLHFNVLNRLSNGLLGARRWSLDRRHSAALAPPWPDVIVAAGRKTAPIAQWVREQSGGRTRIVQLGRKGADRADDVDLAVVCAHFHLPVHPRRVQTLAPLTEVTPARLDEAGSRWGELFAATPQPHVALLVGGTSAMHRLDRATAERMAREVAAWVRDAGGTLFTVTSPRTGPAATAGLRAGLGDAGRLYVWQRGDPGNPYLGCLVVADALVVTGDSESMLAEAAATEKPLYIYPVPERRRGIRDRLRVWVLRHAQARPLSARGAVRPQQGLEYLCARAIERGIVRPPRDLQALHRDLVAGGYARPFGAPLDTAPRPRLHEIDAIAGRVRVMFGDAPPVGAP